VFSRVDGRDRSVDMTPKRAAHHTVNAETGCCHRSRSCRAAATRSPRPSRNALPGKRQRQWSRWGRSAKRGQSKRAPAGPALLAVVGWWTGEEALSFEYRNEGAFYRTTNRLRLRHGLRWRGVARELAQDIASAAAMTPHLVPRHWQTSHRRWRRGRAGQAESALPPQFQHGRSALRLG